MPTLDMEGPYPFKEKYIDPLVDKEKIGNYLLGKIEGELFHVWYVGRSDTDLNRRLREHISEDYTHFMYSYQTHVNDAYTKECTNFHGFNGTNHLNNQRHPNKPEGCHHLNCPHCGI